MWEACTVLEAIQLRAAAMTCTPDHSSVLVKELNLGYSNKDAWLFLYIGGLFTPAFPKLVRKILVRCSDLSEVSGRL